MSSSLKLHFGDVEVSLGRYIIHTRDWWEKKHSDTMSSESQQDVLSEPSAAGSDSLQDTGLIVSVPPDDHGEKVSLSIM